MLQVHSHARKRQQEGKKWGRKSVYMAEKSSECKEMGERSQKEAANALPGNVCVCVCTRIFFHCACVCMSVCVLARTTDANALRQGCSKTE